MKLCGGGFALRLGFTVACCLLQTPCVYCAEWMLVWSDEFDDDGAPNPSFWGYEVGFNRNEEEQWYTNGRLENARVEKGHLVIEARRETWANPNFVHESKSWRINRKQAQYTSASLITKSRKEIRYGLVQVRARIPNGQGVWPAIWTLGANIDEVGYPKCGEIDIAEFFGNRTGKVFTNIHYQKSGVRKSVRGQLDFNSSAHDNFQVYSMEWNQKQIEFKIGDQLVKRFSVDEATEGAYNPFYLNHYLILNLALGGLSGGKVDDSIFPVRFYVDFVRVYEKQL